VLKESGLGESFGKVSLANTAFRLGRFVPMRDRSSWMLKGWLSYSSEAWPDEALKGGVAQVVGKEKEKLGEGKFPKNIDAMG